MPPGVRRPAGLARRSAAVLVALLSALVVSACGSVGQPAAYDPTGVDGLEIPTPSPVPADFVGVVDNPWFPLGPVDSKRYVVEEDGERVGSVRVEVLGLERVAGLQATSVETRTEQAAREPSTVTAYYAQDQDGNVWLVGEDRAGGSWRAGQAGAQAGLAMPAEPRVGDGWVRASVPGVGEQIVRVEEPGSFTSGGVSAMTVRTTEVDPDGRSTVDEYQAGLGLIESIEEGTGRTTKLVQPPPR